MVSKAQEGDPAPKVVRPVEKKKPTAGKKSTTKKRVTKKKTAKKPVEDIVVVEEPVVQEEKEVFPKEPVWAPEDVEEISVDDATPDDGSDAISGTEHPEKSWSVWRIEAMICKTPGASTIHRFTVTTR